MKIKKPQIELETVGIFYMEDGMKHQFDVNYFEFNEVRIQIKNNKLTGYYVCFDSKFYPIDTNGRVKDWPSDMFRMMDDQLIIILDCSID